MVQPILMRKKSRVLHKIKILFFATKHNQIIIYRQISNLHKTFGVGWAGMNPQENLYGVKDFTQCTAFVPSKTGPILGNVKKA